jgi:hypothetical protein
VNKKDFGGHMFKINKQKSATVAFIFTAVLSACSSGAAAQPPTPTAVDLNAIYTQVAQTVVAEHNAIAQRTSEAATAQAALATPTVAATTVPTFSFSTPTLLAGATPFASITDTAPIVPVQTGCDGMTFITDLSAPDGTVFHKDYEFWKEWRVKNTGSCTWTQEYKVSFVGGDAIGGAYSVRVGHDVQPGELYDVKILLKTPLKKGNFSGSWRMQNASGEFFGPYLTCVITVNK